VRALIRGTVEHLVVGSGMAALASRSRRNRTLVLAYHNVVPDGEGVPGDRSLHLSLGDFRRQLDLVQRHGEVIPLEEAWGPAANDVPRFVLTFDDAYRGTILVALPELAARGLSATIFVPPGLLGGEAFWWDAVPVSGWENPTPMEELRGEADRVRRWALEQGMELRSIPHMQLPCTVEELREATTQRGIRLGCHTWDHPNLERLSAGEIRDQMSRNLTWLEESGLPTVPWVAYPYGKTSGTVRQVVRELGLSGGLRVDGGWLPLEPGDPFDVPRINVPAGISTRGFRILLSGLRPG
jgi:peptidoglycan/xylan/chitin deacetylase (PgdA/CDA1 family)